jgi:hypothetical protein
MMALNGTGQVGPLGSALYVTVAGRLWGIDMDSDPAFGSPPRAAGNRQPYQGLCPPLDGLGVVAPRLARRRPAAREPGGCGVSPAGRWVGGLFRMAENDKMHPLRNLDRRIPCPQ